MMTWWFTNTRIDYFKDGLCFVLHVHIYITDALTIQMEQLVCVCVCVQLPLPTSEIVLVGPLTVCWNDFNDLSIVSFLCVWLNASPT